MNTSVYASDYILTQRAKRRSKQKADSAKMRLDKKKLATRSELDVQ